MTDRNDKNEIVPSAPRGLAKQGLNLVHRGLDDLSKLEGSDAGTWIQKATDLAELGHYNEAIGCLERSLELDPENPHARLAKGMMLCELGRFDEARGYLENAIQLYSLSPDLISEWHIDACYWKGIALKGLGRLEEAIACFERILEMDPQLLYARRRLEELKTGGMATPAAFMPSSPSLRCSACGRNSDAAAKFCSNCGKTLVR